jgi:hypothetical protein
VLNADGSPGRGERSGDFLHPERHEGLSRVDLRRLITQTRWPEKETVTDTSQGVQLATMQAPRPLLG